MSYYKNKNESTKVQTLGWLCRVPVGARAMKRVFEKAHTLLKCTSNGGIRNIGRQKMETIT